MGSPGLRRGTRSRHEQLVGLLRSGMTRVEDLAVALGVSPSTVRRDLGLLTRDGQVARTYGGALVPEAFHELGLGERETLAPEAKAAIGRLAATMVPDHSTVFLDAGSTCARLAEHLCDRQGA